MGGKPRKKFETNDPSDPPLYFIEYTRINPSRPEEPPFLDYFEDDDYEEALSLLEESPHHNVLNHGFYEPEKPEACSLDFFKDVNGFNEDE
jgi:hypothetical protein